MSSGHQDSSERNHYDDDDDDDYDFAENNSQNRNQHQGDGQAQAIENAPYDEVVEVSGDSEVPSNLEPEQEEQEGKEDENQIVGAYDLPSYADLPVSQEVRNLFKYITRFRPTNIELNTSMKPFIPNYIPAVGEADAFLKPSKPDNTLEGLGLVTIDEPRLNQSSFIPYPGSWRRLEKAVDSIENADKNPKDINRWIKDVSCIKRQPPSVGYSEPFPDVEKLMQVWPAEIEDALQNLLLPSGNLDMSVEEYVRLASAITDIPVHNTTNGKNLIESLHVFFTLFAELKANPYFQQQIEQFVYEGSGYVM